MRLGKVLALSAFWLTTRVEAAQPAKSSDRLTSSRILGVLMLPPVTERVLLHSNVAIQRHDSSYGRRAHGLGAHREPIPDVAQPDPDPPVEDPPGASGETKGTVEARREARRRAAAAERGPKEGIHPGAQADRTLLECLDDLEREGVIDHLSIREALRGELEARRRPRAQPALGQRQHADAAGDAQSCISLDRPFRGLGRAVLGVTQ